MARHLGRKKSKGYREAARGDGKPGGIEAVVRRLRRGGNELRVTGAAARAVSGRGAGERRKLSQSGGGPGLEAQPVGRFIRELVCRLRRTALAQTSLSGPST